MQLGIHLTKIFMQLQARISIMTEDVDKPFYYTKDHEEIKQILGSPTDSMGMWDLEIGSEIEIRGVKCVVRGFLMRVLPKVMEPHNYGINLYRVGQDHPYNIDFTILVNKEAIILRHQ
jgi:hypothetical protein